MEIECIQKRNGGSRITMADATAYHFKPNEEGAHVANVPVEAHVERLLSIKEAFRAYLAPGAQTPVGQASEPTEPDVQASPTPVVPPSPVSNAAINEPNMASSHPAHQDAGLNSESPQHSDLTVSPPKSLADMSDEELRAEFETVVGRKPNGRAGRETMINQIEVVRDAPPAPDAD